MDFEIDTALTAEQNFHKIVNSAFKDPIQMGVYYPYRFYNVTPTIANKYANTRILIRGVEGADINGETNVTYRRLSLAENQPGAGNRTFIDNSVTTHAQALDKICEHFGLIKSELNVTYPKRVPWGGGDSQVYGLSVKTNSLLYTGSSLSVTVKNTDEYTPVDPAVMFGQPTGIRNERLVYTIPSMAMASYFKPSSERDTFDNMLDVAVATDSFKFKESDLILTNLAADPTGGNWAYVDFEPGPGSPLSAGGTFRYNRKDLTFLSLSFPLSYKTLYPDYAEMGPRALQYNNIPTEKYIQLSFIIVSAGQPGSGNRFRSTFAIPADSLVIQPETKTYTFMTAR